MPEKCIIINFDGMERFLTGDFKYEEIEDIYNVLEPFRNSGLSIFEWSISFGTKANYLSKFFELYGTGEKTDLSVVRRGDRYIAETLSKFAKDGTDPFLAAGSKCHELGIQIYASMRMNPDYGPEWMGEWLPNLFNETWYFEHPEYRLKQRNGALGAHRSYAYEAVRDRKLLQIEELGSFPIDGINLDFNRHPPYVGYDTPSVDLFQQAYGLDPLLVEEDDLRWIRVKCEVMTDFMRKVRILAADKQISVRVDHLHYMQHGLDIETWINEGLIDLLIITEHGSLGGFTFDLTKFKRMTEGKCKLNFGEEAVCSGHDLSADEDRALAEGKDIDVTRRRMSLDEYCERALEWYAQGADGIHIFNDAFNYEVPALLIDPVKAAERLANRQSV